MSGVPVVGCTLRVLSDMNEAKCDSKAVHDISGRYLKRTIWVIGSVMLRCGGSSDGEEGVDGDVGVRTMVEEDSEDEGDMLPVLGFVSLYLPLDHYRG
jgi:hypothetical protein